MVLRVFKTLQSNVIGCGDFKNYADVGVFRRYVVLVKKIYEELPKIPESAKLICIPRVSGTRFLAKTLHEGVMDHGAFEYAKGFFLSHDCQNFVC